MLYDTCVELFSPVVDHRLMKFTELFLLVIVVFAEFPDRRDNPMLTKTPLNNNGLVTTGRSRILQIFDLGDLDNMP